MVIQPSLCRTWSEIPKTGFLATQLILLQELRQLVVLDVEEEFNEKLVLLKRERDRLKKSKQVEGEAVSRGRQDASSDS